MHAVWAIITGNKKGYSKHPETLRWKGKLRSLYARHERLVKEMRRRGYNHKSKLPVRLAKGIKRQNDYIDSIKGQISILKRKRCGCRV